MVPFDIAIKTDVEPLNNRQIEGRNINSYWENMENKNRNIEWLSLVQLIPF